MKREFKVGDICRIREWDDMFAEFGGDNECIDCDFSFTSGMKYLCGKTFTIAEMYARDSGTLCVSKERVEDGYSISTDMLELLTSVDCPTFEAADIDTLLTCLGE